MRHIHSLFYCLDLRSFVISYGNQIQGETFTSLNQTGEGFLLELWIEGNPKFIFLAGTFFLNGFENASRDFHDTSHESSHGFGPLMGHEQSWTCPVMSWAIPVMNPTMPVMSGTSPCMNHGIWVGVGVWVGDGSE